MLWFRYQTNRKNIQRMKNQKSRQLIEISQYHYHQHITSYKPKYSSENNPFQLPMETMDSSNLATPFASLQGKVDL